MKRWLNLFFLNKRGDVNPIFKQIIYWILVGAFIIILWFIVNGIIKKLLTLY